MPLLRLSIAALAIAAVTAPALAQGTPQQRAACRGDAARYCKGMEEGSIQGCLQSNYSKISARCQKVLSGG